MATVGDLINATYRHLTGMTRQEQNLLSISAAASDTVLTMSFETSNIAQGDFLSIDDEIVYVWETDPGNRKVTVQRAQLGTVAATHTGSVVERNPRFPRFFVRQALRDEIMSWGDRVWDTDTLRVQATRGKRAIKVTSMAADYIYGLELVRKKEHGDGYVDVRSWTLQQGVAQSTYLNQVALILEEEPTYSWVGSFTYALPFNVEQFSDTISLENIVHLPPAYQDIPPLGAVARLMVGKDVIRSFTEAQGEPRDAAEVQLGSQGQVAQRFRQMADLRLANAATQLLGRYPWKKK